MKKILYFLIFANISIIYGQISIVNFAHQVKNDSIRFKSTHSPFLINQNNLSLSPFDLIIPNDLDEDGVMDTDEDGVINDLDQCPNTPQGVTIDVNGCEVFNLPQNNFSISVESLSCIGENDGSISISVEDEDLDYTLRLNGGDPTQLNSSDGYQQTLSNLSPGTYQLCFTVDGQSGYNQCFDVSISEPAPLSSSSKVNETNKSISFSLSGSDQYTIIHNGIKHIYTTSNPTIDLKTGLNFIEVKTDKLCQGVYTEEVFVSERVEYYPNPTNDLVNLYIHGKDNHVDLTIVDRDGNIMGTSCEEIRFNRKVKVNLGQYSKGVYIIRLRGNTILKTVKIIKE